MNKDAASGYLDGRNPDSPEPGTDRSEDYRQAFAKGREDLERQRPPAEASSDETLEVHDDISIILWHIDRDFFAREEGSVTNQYDFDVGLQTAVLLLLKAEREGRLPEVMAALDEAELSVDLTGEDPRSPPLDPSI